MNETIVYLIRHSRKLPREQLEHSKDVDNYQVIREKIVLSIDGEKRAEILSKQEELQDLDIIYSSHYVRAIQTAKYFAEPRNMLINIEPRFKERRLGIIDENNDIYFKQFYDENLKNEDGETRKEVAKRMKEVFFQVVEENRGKKIGVFTHADSMTFLLMEWCEFGGIDDKKTKTLSFNGKTICNKIFDAPEVFKVVVGENNEIKSIENLEFEDLKDKE